MSANSNQIHKSIVFDEESSMLLESASGFCQEKSGITQVRALLDSESGFDESVWREQIALGWMGVCVPEEHGGSDMGFAALVAIIECAGRHLLATPLLHSSLACQGLLLGGTETQIARWVPELCEGKIATLALTEAAGSWNLLDIQCRASREAEQICLSGIKTFVFDAQVADLFIVSVVLDDVPTLVVIERADLSGDAIQRETILDETRRSYRLCLDGVRVSAENVLQQNKTVGALNEIYLLANLLISAELAGSTAATLNVMIEYLNTRKQFGRLIGSYQALKHPTVDVLMGLEASRSLVYHAATLYDAFDENTDEVSAVDKEIAVRMSKARACEAAVFAGDRAVQFHGGFGFTYECDAQLYLRRALCSQFQFGDSAHHRKNLTPLLLD